MAKTEVKWQFPALPNFAQGLTLVRARLIFSCSVQCLPLLSGKMICITTETNINIRSCGVYLCFLKCTTKELKDSVCYYKLKCGGCFTSSSLLNERWSIILKLQVNSRIRQVSFLIGLMLTFAEMGVDGQV